MPSFDYNDDSSYSMNTNYDYDFPDMTQSGFQCPERRSKQVVVQNGNLLDIIPGTDTSESLADPQELKEKRKLVRDEKRKAKMKRKEKLREEIQSYLDRGVRIEDSEEEIEICLENLKISEDNVKSIMKISSAEKKNDKRVIFSDGLYPHECSDDYDDFSLKEKRKRIAIPKKKSIKEPKETEEVYPWQMTEKGIQSYEDLPPPSPPHGPPKASNALELKKFPHDVYEELPKISIEAIKYQLSKDNQFE